jgi:N,N'-diacetyllegionaminate synthase
MIKPIKIGNRWVGPGRKPFIVAEAAINHQGDFATAEKMVRIAHTVGADAIKFQLHILDNEMLQATPQSDNFDEPLYETLHKPICR